ncbi:hypothetical protein JCM3770_005702 [Rhodotorula araucariae]
MDVGSWKPMDHDKTPLKWRVALSELSSYAQKLLHNLNRAHFERWHEHDVVYVLTGLLGSVMWIGHMGVYEDADCDAVTFYADAKHDVPYIHMLMHIEQSMISPVEPLVLQGSEGNAYFQRITPLKDKHHGQPCIIASPPLLVLGALSRIAEHTWAWVKPNVIVPPHDPASPPPEVKRNTNAKEAFDRSLTQISIEMQGLVLLHTLVKDALLEEEEAQGKDAIEEKMHIDDPDWYMVIHGLRGQELERTAYNLVASGALRSGGDVSLWVSQAAKCIVAHRDDHVFPAYHVEHVHNVQNHLPVPSERSDTVIKINGMLRWIDEQLVVDEALGWAVAAGVCYAAYKLIFGSGPSNRRREISQAAIDQVLAVFPTVSPGAARWELERNGGSVERAVERALREGGLPEPPASYFPPPPEGSAAATPRPATPTPATPVRGASSSAQAARGPPPSLIKRMGLQAKVAAEDKGKSKEAETTTSAGWSPDASQREQNLRARKEKLVLEARRKLLEKQQRQKEAEEAKSSSA